MDIHTYIPTYIHTYMHTYIHTHTYVWQGSLLRSSFSVNLNRVASLKVMGWNDATYASQSPRGWNDAQCASQCLIAGMMPGGCHIVVSNENIEKTRKH